MENPTIDYLSLDVEGAELDILKTIPWEKVDIKVLTVEFNNKEQYKRDIVKLLVENGYKLEREIGKQDLVFVKI